MATSIINTWSLDQAIRLNNDGIAHALNGDDDHAIACFSRSLCMFKQLITEDDGDHVMSDSSARLLPTLLHSTSHALPQLRDSGFFLFNRVISLANTKSIRPEDNHIYCSIIILNLAVLHHQTAIRGDSARRRVEALRKAERFYDMVASILANEHYANSYQPSGVLTRLAALNNLAYLRMEKGDFGTSFQHFQMLAWLVNLTQVDQSSLFHEQDLEGMMLNVLMANRQSVAPAA